jgi:hypothetical protein
MKALIDADIIRYEVGSYGQYVNDDGVEVAKNFDVVADALDHKVQEICALCWATEEPILFLSMDARTKKRDSHKIDRQIARLEIKKGGYNEGDCEYHEIANEVAKFEKEKEYKPNFREAVATKKGYKECRKGSVKPLHYDNLTAYILATYDCVMAEGLEADDLLSIYQRRAEPLTTIICSRDKDLKMVPGMHFSWECGKQAQFGPEKVDELGRLRPIYRGKTTKGEPKLAELKGTGMLFFLAQLITGDPVDSIPGLQGAGVAAAYKALKDVTSVDEGFKAVKELYVKKFDNEWKESLLEQGRLLWMVAELGEDGKPVMWEIPEVLK